MKPEPLKGKAILEMKEGLPEFTSHAQAMVNAGRKVKKPTGKILFYKHNIRSAMEWLKERGIIKQDKLNPEVELIQFRLDDFEEAFEDVIEDDKDR